MELDHNAPPLNPLPGVVWLLVLPMAAIEVVLSLGGAGMIGGPAAVGWRLDALQHYAFSGPLMDWMIQTGHYPVDGLIRFVSYPFVHASPTHTIFVCVFVMALGKFVGEVFRGWAVLAIFFVSAIAGALAYGVLSGSEAPLFGGYPPAYGLIGAFTFLLWTRLGESGANRYRAFTLIGFLLAFQLIFGILFGASTDWIADLAGFAAGFALSFVVVPGGVTHAVGRLRQR